MTIYAILWVSLNMGLVWRTSTPEPTHKGIIWTYIKDVTRYIPLFTEPGTFILELNNLLQNKLNGQYASAYIDALNIAIYLKPFFNSNTLCNVLCGFTGVSYSRTIEPHRPDLNHVKQLSR